MPEVATRPENARPIPVGPEEMPLAIRAAEAVVETVPAEAVAPSAPPCANCGTKLAGPYCSQCGQRDKDYHRSLWRFFHDFLDNFFCWDNKYLLTVKPLVRQPGFLTEEFMAGRRARYVHPLRLFLFTSAMSLALVGFVNHHLEGGPRLFHKQANPSGRKPKQSGQVYRRSQEEKTAKADDGQKIKIANEDADDDDAPTAPTPSAVPTVGQLGVNSTPGKSLAAKIEGMLADSAKGSTGAVAPGRPMTSPPLLAATGSPGENVVPESGTGTAADTVRQVRAAWRESRNFPDMPTAKSRAGTSEIEAAKFDAAMAKAEAAMAKGDAALASVDRLRAKRIGDFVGKSFDSEKAGRIAEEISQGVEQKLSWVALALLPVFALLLRAVYWREDSYYFTHFVYSLHYHTFLFLFWAAYACAGIAAALLPLSGLWNFLLGLCLLLPGWYLFVSLRRMYGESSRRTMAKVVVVGALHLMAILIGVASVGAMAFFSAPR